jgi:hypothetical protein
MNRQNVSWLHISASMSNSAGSKRNVRESALGAVYADIKATERKDV